VAPATGRRSTTTRDCPASFLAADPDWWLVMYCGCHVVPWFTVWRSGFEWWVWVSRDGKRGLLLGGR
jgi:hypothetical protein